MAHGTNVMFPRDPADDRAGRAAVRSMASEGWRCARATIRHAAPSVIEGTVVPLVVFTIVVHSLGVPAALWASLLWSGCALGLRVVRGCRISGILVLTGVGTVFRLVTVVWIASPFVFFLQPVLATAACALAFGLSVPLRRPLAARLGADLVPLPAADWSEPDVRVACSRLSLVWCAALLANAVVTMWLLSTLDVATFVLVRPLVGVVTTLPAIVTSFIVGAAVIRRSDGRLRLVHREPAGTPVAATGLTAAPGAGAGGEVGGDSSSPVGLAGGLLVAG